MKEIVEIALSALEGKSLNYGEVRVVEKKEEDIVVKNGKIEVFHNIFSKGYGIRVYKNGCMGFASSSSLSPDDIHRTAEKAIKIAESSSYVKECAFNFSEENPVKDKFSSAFEIDPFSVSTEKKVSLLFEIDEILRKKPEIALALSRLSFFKTKKILATTQGHYIEQEFIESGGGFSAYAFRNGELQVRSYPESHGGNYELKGFEFIEQMGLKENAERIREEAIALLSAKPCPAGEFDIILLPGQMVLQIHESVGHATELDRVLGFEASYAGTSFATREKLNSFRYASSIVNITADATYPYALGTFGYDDEGVPGQKVFLIEEGILKGYQSSRETAPFINRKSSGSARASSWNRIPIVRMTNINLLPGEWELQELIENTKNGIIMDVNKSWSIDEKRLNFQFACEIAWKIEKGKKGEMYKDPVYYGITPDFWNSCDAICNEKYLRLYGVLNCGKGEPGQLMHVGHATPPARFRKVYCGSKK